MHKQAIVISPYDANKSYEKVKPAQFATKEMIGVPSGRGSGGNPLNKNQYQ